MIDSFSLLHEFAHICLGENSLFNDRYSFGKEVKSKDGGGSRIDSRFLKMLTSSVAAGRTLYTDAYRLTNTNRFTFRDLNKSFGMEEI